MVKSIGHVKNQNPSVDVVDFEFFPEAGEWRYATYAYSKDAQQPVVVYGHSNYRLDVFAQSWWRRVKYCTIFIIIESGFGFVFDDILYYPSKGDVIVIKNDESFATVAKETAYDYYFEIDFPLEFFEQIKDGNMFSKLFYADSAVSPNIISTNDASCDKLIQKFDEMKKAIQSDCEDKDFVVWSYIIQIIDVIYGEKAQNKMYLDAKNLPAKLGEAIEYININFVNLESIDEIAEHCNITATYLARMFKK